MEGASVDDLIRELYDCISGPAGARDWDRLRRLFLPGSRLVRRVQGVLEASTVEEFVAQAAPKLGEVSFYEKEIARQMECFGCTAHILSVYEARWTVDDGEAPMRGVNSLQLIHDGNRWWVVSLMWDDERPETPIPEHLLAPRGGNPGH